MPSISSRLIAALTAASLGASPALAAPPEGCTKGPAEAILEGDLDAAEKALRTALADAACGPVAPELRVRLAYVLAENKGKEPGPACEAMGLFRRIAAESDDALVKSDATARADKLTPVCAGEVPEAKDGEKGADPKVGDGQPTKPAGPVGPPPPGVEAPAPPPVEPTSHDWMMVGITGGVILGGGALIGASMLKLEDRNGARVDYVQAPIGSAAEQEAADRFYDEQEVAQILLGSGIIVLATGAALGIITAGMWPDEPEDDGAEASLMLGPGSIGVMGRW